MTTYRCMACGMGVEVEVIKELDLVEVKPCETCLNVAEEESHEKGLEEGSIEADQASFDEGKEEGLEEGQSLTYRDGYQKGRQEGEVKSSSTDYGRGFDAGLEEGRQEAEIERSDPEEVEEDIGV